MTKQEFKIPIEASLTEVTTIKSIHSLVNNVLEEIKCEEISNKIPTGLNVLDKFNSGWSPTDLIVIGGRPGMGKTALALTFTLNAAITYNKSVAYFTLAENGPCIVKKMLSSHLKLSTQSITNKDFNTKKNESFTKEMDNIVEAPIFIEDSCIFAITELKEKAYELKNKHAIQFLVIDEVQNITHHDDLLNEDQTNNYITKSLKELAISLKIPIIICSQLSTEVETRGGDKRPLISDLRQSECIEAYADIILLLYRPSYYRFTENKNGYSPTNFADLAFVKHKNGPILTVNLNFEPEYGRFSDV